MRILIIALLAVIVSLLAMGSIIINQAIARHPVIEESESGWTFTYDLCVPMPKPIPCVEHEFPLFVPKGTKAIGMSYIQRPVDIQTVEMARIEAEARADVIENVQKDESFSEKLKRFWHVFRKRKMTDE
jgi:hypothetical protein